MKYFKISLTLFLFAFLLSITNVNAEVHGFFGVTVKRLKGIYTSDPYTKTDTGSQYLFESSCTDNLSGDDRTVESRLYRVVTPIYTDWVTAIKNASVSYGSVTQTVTDWKFMLRSKNNFLTTATFYGYVWN